MINFCLLNIYLKCRLEGTLGFTLSLMDNFLNNFVSKHSKPYPDLISVFSLSVRVSTRNITDC
jgi:hypothetical protein